MQRRSPFQIQSESFGILTFLNFPYFYIKYRQNNYFSCLTTYKVVKPSLLKFAMPWIDNLYNALHIRRLFTNTFE